MIGPLQIVLLSIVAAFTVVCGQNWFQTANQPVFTGMMAGIIMGDPVTGLFIGGSMQLTVLGIGTFGGSSHIDANSGAILATAFSVALGMDPSQALAAIAVPVAAILTTADVLGRFCNAFFQQRIDSLIEKDDYAGIERNFLYGAIPWALSRILPVALALIFGQGVVQSLMEVLNGPLKWLGTGLGVAGAVMPAVGFAILLRYLPTKQHFNYLILGFVVTIFFSYLFTNVKKIGTAVASTVDGFSGAFINLPMLGIALVGLFLAVNHYKSITGTTSNKAVPAQTTADTEEDDDDEL
ncbi:PTS sugar transporter subunit IIC [Olsenella uli]|uniref:PTS mannose/fructose/sorbose/N-acetylgalactosamine transporter subunit IIC n=1 Tax=Olsenella uli TaxID=133926 RepID=UPI0012AB85C0|nr:PTS sugar transporter subunit IIC [Olsenella uli]